MTSRRLSRLSVLVATTLAAAAPLVAQRHLATFYGPTANGAFGRAIAAAPDRGGDGPDLLVGMPEWSNGVGRGFWMNAATGQFLSVSLGSGAGARLGTTIAAAGDLNGDQVPDWVLGSPTADTLGTDGGIVVAVNGATGLTLWTRNGSAGHNLGAAIVSLGDLTGDGRPELAVGAPGVDVGNVSLLSGANGQTLRVYSGDPFTRFGSSLALLRPLGSGPLRVLVGEPGATNTPGRLWLIDPLAPPTSAGVWWVDGVGTERVGERVASLGDVSGDGTPDFLASRSNGRVDVRSGLDGSILHTLQGAAGEEFGAAFCGTGDLDGDGEPEIAIGAPAANGQSGAATVYSGNTLAPLFTVAGTIGSRFGEALVSLGDLDGDGRADLAVGAPLHFESGRGIVGRVSVYALRFRPEALTFGTGCRGSLPQTPVLDSIPAPQLGASYDLKIVRAPGNTLCLITQGLSSTSVGSAPLPFDLGPLGAAGCFVRTSAEAVVAVVSNGVGSAASVSQVPNVGSLAGLHLYAQGFALAPANALGLVTTNGLALRVGHP